MSAPEVSEVTGMPLNQWSIGRHENERIHQLVPAASGARYAVLTLRHPDFRDGDARGAVQVDLFCERVIRVSFYPDNPTYYKRRLESERGAVFDSYGAARLDSGVVLVIEERPEWRVVAEDSGLSEEALVRECHD